MRLIQGDCKEVLKQLEENSVDAIVTDPPYELGFMGKSWDGTGIANDKEMWADVLRVLKPGGYLLSFGGTRTYHRMAVAIEDAGFEVRDMIEWVYGSGFPKSLNIGKSIENKMLTGNASKNGFHKLDGERREGRIGMYDTVEEQGFRKVNPDQLGAFDLEPTTDEAKEWNGWGTALKPAHEPICMARKPLAEKTVAENVLKYGTGGINIDESRVESNEDMSNIKAFGSMPENKTDDKGFSRPWMNDKQSILDKQNAAIDKMKSLGRFPANLIHDNSEEVRECFPETKDTHKNEVRKFVSKKRGNGFLDALTQEGEHITRKSITDSGSASRFFKSIIYQAKASKSERNKGCEELEEKSKVFNGQSNKPSKDMKDVEKRFTTLPKANNHPTVKPIALMEYLIKMVTPEGGTVLDPFMGSGSTGVAAKQNGYDFIGIDMTPEYTEIAKARMEAVIQQPELV